MKTGTHGSKGTAEGIKKIVKKSGSRNAEMEEEEKGNGMVIEEKEGQRKGEVRDRNGNREG